MPGEWYGERAGKPSEITGITPPGMAIGITPDYIATAGYTSCPSEPAIEPEGPGPESTGEPASNPLQFDVDVKIDMPPADVAAYDEAARAGRKIFIERRGERGSHLDNPPSCDLAAIHVKTWRILKKLMAGERPSDDDLIDCSNYCLMVVSRQYRNTAG